ncbi:hypothetical protein D3C77_756950 [compost metagenome]
MAHSVEVCRAPLSVEKLEAEFGFQALDLGADGSLRESDPVAGCSESTFACYGDECLQFFDHSQILIVFLRNIY